MIRIMTLHSAHQIFNRALIKDSLDESLANMVGICHSHVGEQ